MNFRELDLTANVTKPLNEDHDSLPGMKMNGSPLRGMMERYLISVSASMSPRCPRRSKTIGSAKRNSRVRFFEVSGSDWIA